MIKGFLLNLILSIASILTAAFFIQGIHFENWLTVIVVSLVLSAFNTILKPILRILTLPINVMTLGLFSFALNGLMILLTSALVSGFTVDNAVSAILFSIVLSAVNVFLGLLKIDD